MAGNKRPDESRGVQDNWQVGGDLFHSGSNAGFFNVGPVAQAAHIADPAGGATVDAEARTAINAILVVIENLGFNAKS